MAIYRYLLVCLTIACFFSAVSAQAHDEVWLRNERGDRITVTLNNQDPYSPKKTCGACHNYAAITSGYHFQQGFDKMKDGYDRARPWILSPGMFGNWLPTARAAKVAAKVNNDARQMDLSTYDWIGAGHAGSKHLPPSPSCGSCHPGGGPLEFGRNSQGQADYSKTLFDKEADAADSLDGDYSSRFTPDGKSHFRQSGVVEADCLLCHYQGYRKAQRDEQLYRRNYRFAATAGAGLGVVKGAVFSGGAIADAGVWNLSQRPVVSYAWSNLALFTQEGRLQGRLIKKRVSSQSCLMCHAAAEAKNTGQLFSPEDDVHVKAGLECLDCHPLVGKTKAERISHQIAKGNSSLNSVRDDLDGKDMKTCFACHFGRPESFVRQGKMRQAKNPRATHEKVFAGALFHTYLLSCQSCHISLRPLRALTVLDMSTGKEYGYTADDFSGALTWRDYLRPATKPWIPWQIRKSQYLAAVPKHKQWFGEKMKNGEIRPIPLIHVEKAARQVGNLTSLNVLLPGGAKQKRLTVVSDRDIASMLKILSRTGFSGVAYVSDKIYELKNGKLVSSPARQNIVHYAVEHGVIPLAKKSAYGRKGNPDGCMQCHDDAAAFFGRQTLKNVREFFKNDYPVAKSPNFGPQYEIWGMSFAPSYE